MLQHPLADGGSVGQRSGTQVVAHLPSAPQVPEISDLVQAAPFVLSRLGSAVTCLYLSPRVTGSSTGQGPAGV